MEGEISWSYAKVKHLNYTPDSLKNKSLQNDKSASIHTGAYDHKKHWEIEAL